MGATCITVPYYRTFIGDAVQSGPHTLCRTEHDALSLAHRRSRPRGQALIAPTDLAGSMTDHTTVLHQFERCPEAPPARAAG